MVEGGPQADLPDAPVPTLDTGAPACAGPTQGLAFGDACAPGGATLQSCGDSATEGRAYSCDSRVMPRGVGTCTIWGEHEAFGTTWVDMTCERAACTRFKQSDYLGLHARCGTEKRHAYACPLDDSAAPPAGCDLHGASWSTGAGGYGPIWCCP